MSQMCELEKQEILEFEGHLAAATSNVTITESNSLLLPQLISMNARQVADPLGIKLMRSTIAPLCTRDRERWRLKTSFGP